MVNTNSKKEIMKNIAVVIREILKSNGYDSNGRVRLYQDLSVECLCYGNKNIQNCVVEGLKKYSNFGMDGFSYCWNEGKYIIYLTIF